MLTVKSLNFSYKKGIEILKDISFDILPSQKVCILGESGSGKSTLLKLIYEELQADSGKIYFSKEELKGRNFQLIPGHEDIKYVPQDFDLDKYIPVSEIVGKHLSNLDIGFKKSRVQEVLKALNIENLRDKKSHELSGGQQQRVAIARALAKKPKLLLLDEPFSQLDASLHIEIRERLFHYLETHKIAVAYTSHRSEDALGYSDKVMIMNNGKIVQQDKPTTIYNSPTNTYVAKLFGQVNSLNIEQASRFNISRNYFKDNLIIYPEEIKIMDNGQFKGKVIKNRFLGKFYEVHLNHDNIILKTYHKHNFNVETEVYFDIEKHRWVKA